MSTISKPEESQTQPSSPQEDIHNANLGLDSIEKRKRQNQQFFYEITQIELHDQIINQIIDFYLQEVRAFWEQVMADAEMKAWEKILLRNMDAGVSLDFVLNLPRNLALMGEVKELQEELLKYREELAEIILEAFKPVSEEENIVVASFEVDGKVVEVRLNEVLECAREELAEKARRGELKSNNINAIGRGSIINLLEKRGMPRESAELDSNQLYSNHVQPRLKYESIAIIMKKSDAIINLMNQINNKFTNQGIENNKSNENIALSNLPKRSKIVGMKMFDEKYNNKPKSEENADPNHHPVKRAGL